MEQPVLVLGATGFVGRRLVAALLAADHRVRCLVRDPQRARDLAGDRVELVQGDMLDAAAVEQAAESVHAVHFLVHTLSRQSRRDVDFMEVEQAGLRNVVDAARRHGVRRLLYLTAIGTAPDAASSWGRGRARTEQMLFASGLDVTVLRPGMIVGHGGDGFGMIERGARTPVAMIMAGRRTRFRTVAVDDLAGALVQLMDEPRAHGRHFDVGSDDILTVGQMIDEAAAHLGRRPPLKLYLPRRAVAALAPVLERAAGMPKGAVAGFVGPGSDADLVGDASPIRSLLSRPPIGYREAMAAALANAS
ncbi:SDR family oxidoreductase [Symbioplanes lichenis]|uniref:SDR family oxidoreductase n=1 Tax=Symbioplanes lichenis TaxID=1629072 RepID=UPI002739A334|nr:NAD(P)H-binding protein [Actinoplanes lichenis]